MGRFVGSILPLDGVPDAASGSVPNNFMDSLHEFLEFSGSPPLNVGVPNSMPRFVGSSEDSLIPDDL